MTDDKGFERPPSLAGVVPMDFAALDASRRSRPEPAPGPAARPAAYGPDWELTVDAGGRLEILEPPALELAAVAALGAALRGVAFVAFGLDLLLPAPAGSDPDDPRPPAPGARQAALNRCIGPTRSSAEVWMSSSDSSSPGPCTSGRGGSGVTRMVS
jgi:hypothetical protein